MTSNQVMNTPDLNVTGLAYSQKLSGRVGKTDFASFMNSSKDATNSTLDKLSTESRPVKSENAKPEKVNEAVKDSVKPAEDNSVDSKVTEVEERIVEENDVETLKEAIETVVSKIEDELDVTEEEIIEALTTLGLTEMALLDPATVPEIAIELTDAEGPISLVTDATLYEAIGNITETIKEVLPELEEELDIDPEVFEAVIKEAAVIPVEEPVETVETVEEENTIKEEIVLPFKPVDEKPVQVNDNDETPVEDKVVFDTNESVGVRTTAQNTADNGNNATDLNKSTEQVKVSTDTEELEVKDPIVTFTQNLIDKTREALNAREVTEVYTDADTQAIIDQITESIRVEATPETTEINLRLHPESLGNVSVRISANHEGAMTAQFIAQNESVKAIIESQALVLRETLEAKGVTVEAVEVMVGSHEFERNLSDSERRNEEQQRNNSRVRRINLDAEEDTELDDEDIIRQDIMRQNGNTIDYTV